MHYLIVGLGNPGNEYKNTRHNAGFLALDYLIKNFSQNLETEKFNGIYCQGKIDNASIIFLKPQTYMNLSGTCVGKFMQFYKIKSDKLIVIHDELDIPFGKIKIKIGGGNAGHNGLKSIDSHVGNAYKRVRIGIGRPKNADENVSSYVLSKFQNEEDINFGEILDAIFTLLRT